MRFENLPISCLSYRLNSHSQLDRLYVYRIYKRTMSVSTKENTLTLATGVTGDNQMQEKGQIESKPSPHQVQGQASPALQGPLGRHK